MWFRKKLSEIKKIRRLLETGMMAEAIRAVDSLGDLSLYQENKIIGLINLAVSLDRADVVARLFVRHVHALDKAHWPDATIRFLLSLNKPDVANTMKEALSHSVNAQDPAAVAVDACLDVAARSPIARRLLNLSTLERQFPDMMSHAPVVAALACLPHTAGKSPLCPTSSARLLSGKAVGGLLVVPASSVSLADIAAVIPDGVTVDVCSFSPTRASTARWTSESLGLQARMKVSVFDTLENDSDLNDAAHWALSRAADAIAEAVLLDPAFSSTMAIDDFVNRHPDVAALSLSDRVFSWLRAHHAFVRCLADRKFSAVLLVSPSEDVRTSVAAILRGRGRQDDLLVMEEGKCLSAMMCVKRVEPSDVSLRIERGTFDTAQFSSGRRDLKPAAGVVVNAGGRLYAPAAESLIEALNNEPISLNGLLADTVGVTRFSVTVPACAASRWISPEVVKSIGPALGLAASDIADRVAVIVERFLSVELPQLFLADRYSREAFATIRPEYGVVMPTRHPPLRILARNLMAAGAVVHEPQVVYLSDMPRYRAPVADRFHALDTHSALQVANRFGLDPTSIRVGGSLRASKQAVRDPRPRGAGFRITLASQPGPISQSLERMIAVVKALKRIDAPWSLALRPHPSESEGRTERYRQTALAAGIRLEIGGALEDTDLLITGFSNVVLEASVADVRTLIYWAEAKPPPVPYAKMGLALQVRSPVALSRLIMSCMNDDEAAVRLDNSRRRYLAQNPLVVSGAATAMAANIRRTTLGPE